jgi:hypothetical protein
MNRLGKILIGVTALTFTAIAFAPAKAQENWVLVGSGGAVTVLIDIGSNNLLPNGVTTYKERIRGANPITGQSMNIDRARGIDCKTKEIVYVADGTREKLGSEKIKATLKGCPGKECTSYAIAFANFCPSGHI